MTAPRRVAGRRAIARGTSAVRPGAGVRDVATRERLIAAAAARFAEHGFANVSVRDVCRDAGANVAAVNYHFDGKLGLYREVVGAAIDAVREMADAVMFAPSDASAAERLRHYVRAYVPRIAGRDSRVDAERVAWIHKLMRHETSEPTPLAPWIAEQAIMPRVHYLSGLVAELLNCDADDPRVMRCVLSVQAQCLFYGRDKFREAAFPGWPPSAAEVAAAADHIAEFSLAGIRRVAEIG